MKELMNLFWSFCRIGGLTFGGGYAMLPMLQKEVVETHKWATEQELLDYYAVGQATPGDNSSKHSNIYRVQRKRNIRGYICN